MRVHPVQSVPEGIEGVKGGGVQVVYGTKDGDVIQSVYIDKDALDDVPPATLQVVITPE